MEKYRTQAWREPEMGKLDVLYKVALYNGDLSLYVQKMGVTNVYMCTYELASQSKKVNE